MHIVRTVVWILMLVALGIFSWANWDPRITVYIWQGIVVDTRLPAIVIVAFLVGFLPMWLLLRTIRWSLRRRIAQLELALRNATGNSVFGDLTAPGVVVADPAAPVPASAVAPAAPASSAPVTATATATPSSTEEGKPLLP